ncbi:MAG TPA: ABC transporter permease [Rhodospirillaceae bacterium]|nr:ABC transporter permease [Rhodospirillaceae bacterium]MBL25315.1 ABC transporter permease [Rhodospirillaceae bacterium]HAT35719.1 ABC transporter permease [Rhodospirillaceae bacterium]
MRNLLIVFRREMASYFATPLAYVFIVIFLVMAGVLTIFIGNFVGQGHAGLQSFFGLHPWFYLFLIPALSMRLWAEERKTGTIELTMTLPLRLGEVVVGKFLAAWCFAGIALALTFPFWITVNYLGNPDNGVILASYIGSWLMAGSYLAIGGFVSALTRNQVIAFVITVTVCFFFVAMGSSIVIDFVGGWVTQSVLEFVRYMSFLNHFIGISKGVLDLRSVVFFVSIIGLFLTLNAIVIDRVRAN